MEMALEAVDPSGQKGIHCSFDIDSLDALEVPSTGTPGQCLSQNLPKIKKKKKCLYDNKLILFFCLQLHLVRGGLTLREGLYIVEKLTRTGRLDAIDLVEVNPNFGTLDETKRTVDAAIEILKASCGTVRSGNMPRLIKDIPFNEKC